MMNSNDYVTEQVAKARARAEAAVAKAEAEAVTVAAVLDALPVLADGDRFELSACQQRDSVWLSVKGPGYGLDRDLTAADAADVLEAVAAAELPVLQRFNSRGTFRSLSPLETRSKERWTEEAPIDPVIVDYESVGRVSAGVILYVRVPGIEVPVRLKLEVRPYVFGRVDVQWRTAHGERYVHSAEFVPAVAFAWGQSVKWGSGGREYVPRFTLYSAAGHGVAEFAAVLRGAVKS